jgi:precorrin-3B synthase
LLAYGLGLPFGHGDAALLENLAEAAKTAGASGMRAAPERALMVIGLTRQTVNAFVADAERLGFIVHANDPRRRVIACAGAPVCDSAHMVTRAIAPRVAAALRNDVSIIHLSGCAKGCAHAATATLTVVGAPQGCGLIANGGTRDAPFAVVPVDQLPAAIDGALREARNV